jgi:alpha-L-rhamnosidase
VEQRVIEAQPFFRYVVHDAVAESGRCEVVGDLCRDWSAFIDRGETTWPETWTGGTHCHGWSSTPTRDLVVRTLGITPAEPGFARVRVAPRVGDLDWVAGAAPTPNGLVTVRADRDHVDVDSPVPAVLDLASEPPRALAPGKHRVARS